MRGYREDGRPTCPSCGQPFELAQAGLDDEGRPRCARCGELASVEAFERRADRARNVDRWRHGRADRLRPALTGHDGRRTKACDDGTLRPLARAAGGELWLRALRLEGHQDLWDYRVASHELEAVTTGDAPSALTSLRNARVLVVLLEGSVDDALVVLSLDTDNALCWSPLHRARNTNRSARDEAADDLASISQLITLAE